MVTYRFPKSHRLRKPAEFRYVFAKPFRSSDEDFTVLARVNELSYARLGLAVSKKTIKKAVQRSYLKRVVRESFRLHQKTLRRIDIVVIARRQAGLDDAQCLRISLDGHWKRLARWCSAS